MNFIQNKIFKQNVAKKHINDIIYIIRDIFTIFSMFECSMDEKQIKQVYDIASMESCSIDFDVGKKR